MKSLTTLCSGLLTLLGVVQISAQSGFDILWQTNTPLTPVDAIAISGDSSRVAASTDNPGPNVKVWDAPTGNLLRTVSYSGEIPLTAALSSNGEYVAAGGSRMRIWRVSDGVRVWIGGTGDNIVRSISYSSTDAYLSIGRGDGINVVNAPLGGGIPFGEPLGEVLGVCFSPDGSTLASANETHAANLWSMPGGELIREFIGHSNVVCSVDFSSDGRLLVTASFDGTARLWNVTNGVCLLVIEGAGGSGSYNPVGYNGVSGTAVKFSADGKLLYTLTSETLKIWRVKDGACIRSIYEPGLLVFDIAKSGKYFAYGNIQGSVVVARMPLVVDEFTRADNETVLSWQGGSGLYQLQSSTNLVSNGWQNLGSATTNTVATNVSATSQFFRVQSLPNP